MSGTDHCRSNKSVTGYLWATLAVLTCPCHLPLLELALGGTAAGTSIVNHRGLSAVALSALFFVFLAAARRAFKVRT
ncbi:broad-spectrum mercury transporter MerE [Cupriavidus sp. NPDC089707]|uniref:broad-spectrum mercury transporter MerE n=1 Tax=Cupriavidus sp. NPDC089707 TaxID=3363963 RepID=UPI003803EB13